MLSEKDYEYGITAAFIVKNDGNTAVSTFRAKEKTLTSNQNQCLSYIAGGADSAMSPAYHMLPSYPEIMSEASERK